MLDCPQYDNESIFDGADEDAEDDDLVDENDIDENDIDENGIDENEIDENEIDENEIDENETDLPTDRGSITKDEGSRTSRAGRKRPRVTFEDKKEVEDKDKDEKVGDEDEDTNQSRKAPKRAKKGTAHSRGRGGQPRVSPPIGDYRLRPLDVLNDVEPDYVNNTRNTAFQATNQYLRRYGSKRAVDTYRDKIVARRRE